MRQLQEQLTFELEPPTRRPIGGSVGSQGLDDAEAAPVRTPGLVDVERTTAAEVLTHDVAGGNEAARLERRQAVR